jgi:hypothetical protein
MSLIDHFTEGELAVEKVPVATPEQQNPASTTATLQKAWVEPEITLHQELKEVTLGIQCQNTAWPKCVSVFTPVVS